MTDPTVVDPSSAVEFGTDHFQFPPIDDAFFPNSDDMNEVVPLEYIDFDFSFEDLEIPLSENLDDFTDPGQTQFEPQLDRFHGVFKSSSRELRHANENCDLSLQSWDSSGVLSSHADSVQVSGYLNVDSPESNGENSGDGVKGLSCPSPDTQGSENYGSNVSEESNNCVVSSSHNNKNCDVVDQKVKLEFASNSNHSNNGNSLNIDGASNNKSVLKRKKEGNDLISSISGNKCRKPNDGDDSKSGCNDNNDGVLSEEEEKRRARLMRNRESAQLSRQRKKHYVEELEEKVRSMHSTIQDLNTKISYFMAENATLRQQMCNAGSGSGGAGGTGVVVPPPPGMYPHPAVMYPWMACPPPYMMKPQGSQVPLVPIPRLKPQQPTQAPKTGKKETSKKAESKKNEGLKTKKVAGVSFLGLLFFFMLVIGFVPMVNQRYGGFREVLTGEGSYSGGGIHREHHGRVLMVNGTEYGEATGGGQRDFSGNNNVHSGKKGHSSGGEPSADEFVRMGNESEPLVASLYVPRNDKLVKIDGNLIIHSILASEKAMASREKRGEETGLVPVPGVVRSSAGQPQLRALGSGPTNKESARSTTNDRKLQQWFREGLAGPMLSSGMCTEVFQFDVSAASSGAIVPSTTLTNISKEHDKNSTHLSKTRNRRILHSLPIPIPKSTHNISSKDSSKQNENLNGNKNSSSSMVVSVLFDPREAGDSDVDGVMGTKSLSRIFVVVLIDSVKYVTYSCMLPFKASAPLVTT